MKHYILSALTALVLSTSITHASDSVQNPDFTPGACYVLQAYDQDDDISVNVWTACNGNEVKFTMVPERTFLGTNNLSDLISVKENVIDAFSGSYTDLTDKPTLFSGSYLDLTNKPTIPTSISQLTNDSGFITSAPVTSVATKTGVVTLVKADVGLSSVDNTADTAKPISTAAQTALNAKADASTIIGTGATIGTAATNANTSQVTNYNLLSGVLGVANGLNDANTAQNDLATKYNDLATKFNTLETELKARTVPSN